MYGLVASKTVELSVDKAQCSYIQGRPRGGSIDRTIDTHKEIDAQACMHYACHICASRPLARSAFQGVEPAL